MTTKLIVTNSITKVEGSAHAHDLVSSALKYQVKNHHAAASAYRKKTGRRWDGTKSIYNKRSHTFPSGLLPIVNAHLEALKVPVEVVDTRKCPGRPSWPVSLFGIELRGYQAQSATKFLTHGQGILKLGTGAGKTETAVAISKAVGVPMMFLVHRVNLMYQAAERFALRWPEAKDKIGIVGNSQFELNYLTFATVQTLHSAIKKYGQAVTDDLAKYGLLVVDEAHRIGAKQFHETAAFFPGAYWRLGLTATPFMSEDPEDNLQLMGAIGNVLHEVKPSELIRAGVLARPYFKFFEINQPNVSQILNPLNDPSVKENWRDVYEHGIINNPFRNRVIIDNTAKLVQMGHKPLVIVQEIGHGQILLDGILAKGVAAEMVTGKNDVAARMKALKMLSSGMVQVIISTNIFDEGIDVKDVSAVVLAAGTKSAPALYQRTGRAIRKKDDGGHAIIIDFIDRQHQILERHSVARYRLITAEQEFTII